MSSMSMTNSNGSFVISSYPPQLDAGRGDWNLPVARTQRKPHPRTEVLSSKLSHNLCVQEPTIVREGSINGTGPPITHTDVDLL